MRGAPGRPRRPADRQVGERRAVEADPGPGVQGAGAPWYCSPEHGEARGRRASAARRAVAPRSGALDPLEVNPATERVGLGGVATLEPPVVIGQY